MQSVIKKWGNSASIRIPSSLMRAANLRLDEPVILHEEEGRLIIEPVKVRHYLLKDLVAKITPENRHSEVDTGEAVGQETL